MIPFVFRAFGRRITSEFMLPGALPSDGESHLNPDERDIHITAGSACLSAKWEQHGSFSLGREGLLVDAQQVASFLCSHDGRSITVAIHPGVSDADVSTYLIANGIPAALWLQKDQLLHGAGAVLSGSDHALLIAGPSCVGKSTILAALLDAEASVVCEDVASLCANGIGFEASGLPAQIQLRPRVETAYEDRAVQEVPESRTCFQAPVGAVVLLAPEMSKDSEPRRISGAEALQGLLQNRYRPAVASLAKKTAEDLAFWAKLAGTVPVYSWNSRHTEPREWSRILSGLCR